MDCSLKKGGGKMKISQCKNCQRVLGCYNNDFEFKCEFCNIICDKRYLNINDLVFHKDITTIFFETVCNNCIRGGDYDKD